MTYDEIKKGLISINLMLAYDEKYSPEQYAMQKEVLESARACVDKLEKAECKAEDCISREEFIEFMISAWEEMSGDDAMQMCIDKARLMPSVYPKSEDYIKANTQLKKQIEMLKLDRDCEKSVLEDIRKQLRSHLDGVNITLSVLAENDALIPKMEGAKDTLEECLSLIDKHMVEEQQGEQE